MKSTWNTLAGNFHISLEKIHSQNFVKYSLVNSRDIHSALPETEAPETKPSQRHFRMSFQEQHQPLQEDCNGGHQHKPALTLECCSSDQMFASRHLQNQGRGLSLHLNILNRFSLQFHIVYTHKPLSDHRKTFLFLPQHLCLLWGESMWNSFWSPSRSLRHLAHVPAVSFTITCGFVESILLSCSCLFPKWPMGSRIQQI